MEKLIFILIVSVLVFTSTQNLIHSKIQSHSLHNRLPDSHSPSSDSTLTEIKLHETKKDHDQKGDQTPRSDNPPKPVTKNNHHKKSPQSPLSPLLNGAQKPVIPDSQLDLQIKEQSESAPLPNGLYNVISNVNLALTVTGNSMGNAQVIGNTFNSQPSQFWLFTNVGGTLYTIKQLLSGLCLDMSINGSADVEQCSGAAQYWNVIPSPGINQYVLDFQALGYCIYTYSGTARVFVDNNCQEQEAIEIWTIQPAANPFADGVYTATAVSNGLFMSAGNSISNGSPVIQGEFDFEPNQYWYFESAGNIGFSIHSLSSGSCMESGSSVQQWQCSSWMNQTWYVFGSGNTNEYWIQSLNSGQCIVGVGTGLASSGYGLNQTNCNFTASTNATSQLWIIQSANFNPPLTNGIYTFESVQSGLYLNANGQSANPYVDQSAFAPNNTFQYWTLINLWGNTYTIMSVSNGLCLTVTGMSLSSGALVQQSQCVGQTNQRWIIESVSTTMYGITSVNSGLCLDVAGASTSSGANVDQATCTGYANQKWIIAYPPPLFAAGNYNIMSVNSGLYLSVAGDSMTDGSHVDQETFNFGFSIVWTFNIIQGNNYEITSAFSGLSLDVSGYSPYSGANIDQWQYVNQTNQQWIILPETFGSSLYYRIMSVHSGLCLEITGGSNSSGANLDQATCNYQANQLWIITRSTLGPILNNWIYTIISVNSNLYLSVAGQNTSNGSHIVQEPWTANSTIQWAFTSLYGNTYTIVSAFNGLCLDVSGMSLSSGALVDQWQYVGQTNQQWTVTRISANTYGITSVISGLCLDVAGASTSSGANVDQATCTGQANQQWIIQYVASE